MKGKDEYKKRVYFLIDFAISENNLKIGNPYIKDYIGLAFDISKKINFRFPKELHRKVCRYCYAIRTSKNTKVRTITENKNHKRQKYLKIHCLECDKIKKIALK
ncbi:MAG TPA: ribonuclease P Rpr2/Rpp21/SNM1 subunit [archaeon]|mgnify:FL=1|jgi:RNase P subunit RPR2|nr:ribonuclease P Rpr2/Rpp21/SNM1 subunit [archaeon]HPV66483.1 ribonuclease P Rpr2/Rpp21/SNM1 subunit [archaeon]